MKIIIDLNFQMVNEMIKFIIKEPKLFRALDCYFSFFFNILG